MSRLTGANETQAQAQNKKVIWFIDLEFPSGTLRYSNGPKEYTVSANTYSRGGFASISGISERSDGSPGQLRIQLFNNSTIRTALDDDYQFSLVNLYVGFLDDDDDLVSGSPFALASFFMSHTDRNMGESTILTLNCEPVISELYRPAPVYPSPRDQKQRNAASTIFDRTGAIVGFEFEWGGVRYGGSSRGSIGSGHGSFGTLASGHYLLWSSSTRWTNQMRR